MPEFQSNSPQKTEIIAKEFAENLKPFDFISITGSLGVGKTKFTSGIVNFFCADKDKKDYILSPTYTIMNSYSCNAVINHFDFYRLKLIDELENCGFFDSLMQEVITIAEWTDKIPIDYKRYVEGDYYEVDIDMEDDKNVNNLAKKGKRYIKIEKIL